MLAALALVAGAVIPVRAHDALGEYIWHRVEFAAGPHHLDVSVRLTFFEDWSERERRRMDADGDGRIQKLELQAYVARLANAVSSQVTLLVAGRRVALVPLYAPEVDLLGRAAVGRAHHQLTLEFFAPLPPELAPGTDLVVEDRLWSEASSFGEVTATAVERGGSFTTEGIVERNSATRGPPAPLRFSATYVKSAAGRTPAQ